MRRIMLFAVAAVALAACATSPGGSGGAPIVASQAVGTGAQKVYSVGDCVGAVVNGVCHGAILPSTATPKTCHGEMLGGQCTGPMF